MEAFLVSTGLVALAEIGDKTQLLAFLLAARYPGRALTISLGILIATLVNHAGAGFVGHWLTGLANPQWLRWGLGLGFIAMAAWTMVPDQLDEETEGRQKLGLGVLGTTVVAFFLAEMGDKTQIATVGLAARFDSLLAVVAGTTLGMMIANVPAVLLGERLAGRMPVQLVHRIAAVLFAVLGIATLLGAGQSLGL
ncbi:TMEM165/GDT1 family protein [Pelomonas sp. SE-A7]|uniref:TMEM165/GDT1 family protein n=1 Tax=Pelomonas sp. SE-A7 TaxID=3054953 RepID=UPI00259C73B1|nr:TMEM165/GDT1 family protein [Pelomonas sp. SE-A7]MDM4768209.1 TMEM165/GDT1 family protein [Pelomonas sp. SE-A7]